MTRNILKYIFALFSIFCIKNSIYADIYNFEDVAFTIDIPESYVITDSQPGAFFFESKLMPVKFALKFYPEQEFSNSKAMIQSAIESLNAKGVSEEFDWYGRKCCLSTFQFVMPDQNLYAGWALGFSSTDFESKKQCYILMLTYADIQISHDCDQYMLSILDSIFLEQKDFRRPGPITTFAFPNTENESESEEIIMNIGGKTIYSSIKSEAVERSKFVLEREYAVLKIYANHLSWKEAWQRYYRQIFRESFNIFDQISNDIYKSLLPSAQKANFVSPELEIIQMLLDWVQDMKYERDNSNTDFTVVAAAIQGQGCDCDSRSMLMCIILEHLGIKSELFISREYNHAVFGAAVNQNGAKINVDGIDYVLGETTAKVNFGLIAQEQSDTTKWIEVDLP